MWDVRMYPTGATQFFSTAGRLSSGTLEVVPAARLYHTGKVIRTRKSVRLPMMMPRSRMGLPLRRLEGLAAQVGRPLFLSLHHERVSEELVHPGHLHPRR